MPSKIWKKIGLGLLVIFCLINILNKVIGSKPLLEQLTIVANMLQDNIIQKEEPKDDEIPIQKPDNNIDNNVDSTESNKPIDDNTNNIDNSNDDINNNTIDNNTNNNNDNIDNPSNNDVSNTNNNEVITADQDPVGYFLTIFLVFAILLS